MILPFRTTTEDIDVVCGYLTTKPTGATLAEARAIVDSRHLDGRKLAAMKFWHFIEDAGEKMRITERGRRLVKQSGSSRSDVLREVIREVRPYAATVERAALRREETITATEVAANWYDHFKGEVSDSEKILNDQAVCFFQIAQGADLGTLVIGRKGLKTRFDFDADALSRFIGESAEDSQHVPHTDDSTEATDLTESATVGYEHGGPDDAATQGNRVFVTHGKNRKILDQVKELLAYGKFEPVVAQEHETAAKPVPKKVMDDMRTCGSAVIHVGAEGILYNKEGNEIPQINGNVLIEIGAAMALYGEKFILLVEEGVALPSNLQGLYECRYEGDELNMSATMKLLKAFNTF